MSNTETNSTRNHGPSTREEARGLAFEMIDALGEAGALRFHEDHKASATLLMGLLDAMDDHGMSFDCLPR